MKFTIQRSEFLGALVGVGGVAESKSLIAVLSHVLMEIRSDDRTILHTTVTDYDVVLQHRAELDDTAGRIGAVAVPAKPLHAILKMLPEIAIDVNVDPAAHRVEIEAGKSRYELFGMDPEDYPARPEAQTPTAMTVPRTVLKSMLGKVAFAMSNEEARLNLNGVLFEVKAGRFRMVACDGHRLATTWFEPDKDGPMYLDCKGIVHASGIKSLGKVLDATASDVTLEHFKSGDFIFDIGERTVLSVREIDEEYPDWSSIIPEPEGMTTFNVDVAEILEALRRVKPVVDANTLTVKIVVENESLTISAENAMLGRGSVNIYADYGGPVGRTVGFNHAYIGDVLSKIDSPQAIFELYEHGTCIIRPSDPDEAALYLVQAVELEEWESFFETVKPETEAPASEGGDEE